MGRHTPPQAIPSPWWSSLLVTRRDGDLAATYRLRSCWALLAAGFSVVLALSAGVGPSLSADAWTVLILAGPASWVTLVAFVMPAPAVPSSVLLSRSGDKGDLEEMWRWMGASYALPLLAPVFLMVAEYVGAALSALRAPPRGLGPLLFSNADLGWDLPLFGLAVGVLLGWVGIIAITVPTRNLARVPALWVRDRTEALRVLASVVFTVGLWLTCWAQGVMVTNGSNDASTRWSVLRDEYLMLMGRTQMDVAPWVRVVAWAGVICLAAAAATVWRTRRSTPG